MASSLSKPCVECPYITYTRLNHSNPKHVELMLLYERLIETGVDLSTCCHMTLLGPGMVHECVGRKIAPDARVKFIENGSLW